MSLSERIKKRVDELYKERYGKRRDISTEEKMKVDHDAAVQVQKEIREEQQRR